MFVLRDAQNEHTQASRGALSGPFSSPLEVLSEPLESSWGPLEALPGRVGSAREGAKRTPRSGTHEHILCAALGCPLEALFEAPRGPLGTLRALRGRSQAVWEGAERASGRVQERLGSVRFEGRSASDIRPNFRPAVFLIPCPSPGPLLVFGATFMNPDLRATCRPPSFPSVLPRCRCDDMYSTGGVH